MKGKVHQICFSSKNRSLPLLRFYFFEACLRHDFKLQADTNTSLLQNCEALILVYFKIEAILMQFFFLPSKLMNICQEQIFLLLNLNITPLIKYSSITNFFFH